MSDSKAKPEITEATEITEVGGSKAYRLNQLTEMIIGAAIEVHRNTGPGLMEAVYEECLCYELSQLGLKFQRQVELPVSYKQIKLKCGFRMDLVVEDAVVLELKTVDQLLPIHSAQLLTYLKLSGKKVGLLINFNETVLRRGLKRLANVNLEPSEALPSVFSVSSVLSGFDFKSLCLCASVVNTSLFRFKETALRRVLKRLANVNLEPSEALPSVVSVSSVLSGFDFKTLRLCVSAVNN
jgi:GxxExxY protein